MASPHRNTNAFQKLATTLTPFQIQSSPKTILKNDSLIDAHIVKMRFDPNTSRSNFKVMDSLRRGDLSHARNLFDQMPHKNTNTTHLIISSYVKQGDIYTARQFDTMLQRMAVTCTILIGGYSQCNEFWKRSGMQPDYVTFATLLSEDAELDAANELSIDGQSEEAIQLILETQNLGYKPSDFSFVAVLCAVIGLDDLKFGQQVHGCVVKTNFTWNVFVAMRCSIFTPKMIVRLKLGNFSMKCRSRMAECNRFKEAKTIFSDLSRRSQIPWTALISAFKMSCMNNDMGRANVSADQATFASILRATANLASLSLGRQLHSTLLKSGFMSSVFSGSASPF
ncbi:hypothetical protein PanWU01x14_063990 [Parasponia andersonii]|uniref:Pentatricopeptide repeat n=1 Tax=Parasponia andersonii TaxID=3476 RepID=A0A2P5DHA0_PARAD|nr:hypothetical protein PanWU01x14_063990 [Parasponia andersonii]